MRFKRIYHPILAFLVGSVAWCARHFPRRLVLACGDGLGRVAYHFFGRKRRRALENLARVYGNCRPRSERVRIMRDFTRLFVRSSLETMRIAAMSEREVLSLVDADSFEPIEKALAGGKGLVIYSAHFGAWEVLGAYLAARLGKPLHAVGLRLYYSRYNDMIVSNRRSAGVETIYQDQGARPLLAVLRRNLPLAILGDVDVLRLNWVGVEFFGQTVYVPAGPASLARASGAAMVPVFITWKGRRHHVHVLPEIELARTRDKRADVARSAQAWTNAVESIVRLRPEQWIGWHSRWLTEPPAEKAKAYGSTA